MALSLNAKKSFIITKFSSSSVGWPCPSGPRCWAVKSDQLSCPRCSPPPPTGSKSSCSDLESESCQGVDILQKKMKIGNLSTNYSRYIGKLCNASYNFSYFWLKVPLNIQSISLENIHPCATESTPSGCSPDLTPGHNRRGIYTQSPPASDADWPMRGEY